MPVSITSTDPLELARAERIDLASLLTTLTPDQWRAPSLCERWAVRDVVAHMISYDSLTTPGLVWRFLRGGLRLNSVNAIGVRQGAELSTDELLASLNAHLTPTGVTAGFKGRIGLTDGLIHHQDIRRALGLVRVVPPERLVPALDFALTAPALDARRLTRGLRLIATDLDWCSGSGPEVRGPAEALLMAVAGRRGITAELTGPGQALLARRIGA